MDKHLLDIKNLKTVFHMDTGDVCAIDNVSLHLDEGEIVSIVGESGSGKSVTMLSVLQLIQAPGKIVGGEVLYNGDDLLKYPANGKEMNRIRGGEIGMVFQEPMTSLNPVLTIGQQITENLLAHQDISPAKAKARTIELLDMVGIPDSAERLSNYPTQFSGGMRQRIMIAMAMANNPKILIADEATTALDVTTQEQILELLRDVIKKTNTSLIIITHNMSVVARYADRVYVMYAGTVVEDGTAMEIFKRPSHPYTNGLLKAIPRLDSDKKSRLIPIEGVPLNPSMKDEHCPFRVRCKYSCDQCEKQGTPPLRKLSETHEIACYRDAFNADQHDIQEDRSFDARTIQDHNILEVSHVSKLYPIYSGFLRREKGKLKALNDVTFTIREGETVGLVGESGCGKTTLAKSILKLHSISGGHILYRGTDIAAIREREMRPLRKEIQFIFQDPFGSLDPRQTVESIVGEPLITHHLANDKDTYLKMVIDLLQAVGIDPALRDRVPHEFSGGQRQRIGIARALASQPSFIICDEPVSALDVSIQAQIINLLIDLQAQRNLTYLFIAHDLSVVRHISDRIIVMYLGMIMEISPCGELYNMPLHPYTKMLLSAIPIPDPEVEKNRKRVRIDGEIPSPYNRPEGCVFSTRCPYATDKCKKSVPELIEKTDGHFAACWNL